MKIALLTNILSPHQVPLAKALIKLIGEENYTYVYTEPLHKERAKMGWGEVANAMWCRQGTAESSLLLDADILLSGHRALDLFEKRNALNKRTYYVSERWFKPPLGILRLILPSYFKMVRRFLRCLTALNFILLPIGIHAARDMARLMGLFQGDLLCLFRTPKVAFESKPGGRIIPLKDAIKANFLSDDEIRFGNRYGFVQIPERHWGKVESKGIYAKMRMWGYFVAPGKGATKIRNEELEISNCTKHLGEGGHTLPIQHPPRVLWVGRMLNWKRVDVLVRACRPNPDLKRVDVSLSLYGHGPVETKLRTLAKGVKNISFHDFVPVEDVRDLMRNHDIYVLPSNGYEGWGAVISEALEEGMQVLGTVEAGASATILPPTNLFEAGSVRQLRDLLSKNIPYVDMQYWTADFAAKSLIDLGS